MKIRTVYHPTLEGVTHDVSENFVDAWKASGWRLTPPKTAAAETAADEASTDKEGKQS